MSRYAINTNNAAWREVDGELILINLENTYYYSLNASGAFLWSLLQGKPHSSAELTAAIVAHYSIAESVASNDVAQVLDMLNEEGLIKEVSE